MRIRCTDDADDDIMPNVGDLFNRDDDPFINQPEIDMAAKKKDKPTADEGKGTTKKDKKSAKTESTKTEKKAAGKKPLPEGFGPREIPEGHVGLAALAEKAGRTPASARRILRGSDITKPEGQHGWYWKEGSKEAKKVAELLAKKEEVETE